MMLFSTFNAWDVSMHPGLGCVNGMEPISARPSVAWPRCDRKQLNVMYILVVEIRSVL